MNNPEWLIIHATATTPEMTEVDARWVDRLHRRKGWLMCGYHEVITRAAERQNHAGGYPTRPLDRAGAHVGGCGAEWNQKTIGISMAGGIDANGQPEDNFTEAQYDALMEAILEYTAAYGIPMDRVIGHRDLIKMTNAAPKACPCFSVQQWLQQKRFGGSFDHSRRRPQVTLAVPEFHTIRPSETFWAVSQSYGVPVAEIEALNPKLEVNDLRVGTKVRLRERR